jgi:hypothetical protein
MFYHLAKFINAHVGARYEVFAKYLSSSTPDRSWRREKMPFRRMWYGGSLRGLVAGKSVVGDG